VGVSSRDFIQSTSREAGVIKWAQFFSQCPPPKICDGKKIVQNFSRFLTTFDFDGEYLRKGSTYQKSEKLLITYHLSRERVKNQKSENLVNWLKIICNERKCNKHITGQFSILRCKCKCVKNLKSCSTSRMVTRLMTSHNLEGDNITLYWSICIHVDQRVFKEGFKSNRSD